MLITFTGGFVMIRKRFISMLIVLFALLFTIPNSSFAQTITFKDVNRNSEAGQAIYQLAERGVISGYKDGTFKPHASVTRGQAAKIIAGALELKASDVSEPSPFKDVPNTDSFYPYIKVLADKGIINGYPDGTFKPNNPITRTQMAKILSLSFDLPEGPAFLPFEDVKKRDDNYSYINSLYSFFITSGTSYKTFSPGDKVTRQQLSLFVTRAENYKKTGKPKVEILKNEIKVPGTFNLDVVDVYGIKSYPNPNIHLDEEHMKFTVNPIFDWEYDYDSRIIKFTGKSEGEDIINIFTAQVPTPLSEEDSWIRYYKLISTKNGDHYDITLEEVRDIFPYLVPTEDWYPFNFKKVDVAFELYSRDMKPVDLSEVNFRTEGNKIYFTVDNRDGYYLVANFPSGMQRKYYLFGVDVEFKYIANALEITDTYILSEDYRLGFEPNSFEVSLGIDNRLINPAEIQINDGQLEIKFYREGLAFVNVYGPNGEVKDLTISAWYDDEGHLCTHIKIGPHPLQ